MLSVSISCLGQKNTKNYRIGNILITMDLRKPTKEIPFITNTIRICRQDSTASAIFYKKDLIEDIKAKMDLRIRNSIGTMEISKVKGKLKFTIDSYDGKLSSVWVDKSKFLKILKATPKEAIIIEKKRECKRDALNKKIEKLQLELKSI